MAKRITKTTAKKLLDDVPEDKKFWCNDGQEMGNLAELQAAFNTMTDDTFRVHANEFKNDFSTWTREVVGDEELSLELQRSLTRLQAAKAVAERIALLKGKATAKPATRAKAKK